MWTKVYLENCGKRLLLLHSYLFSYLFFLHSPRNCEEGSRLRISVRQICCICGIAMSLVVGLLCED